jgi:hypothetical protein
MSLSITNAIEGPVTPGGQTLSLTGSDLGAATVTGTNIAAATIKKANILQYVSGVQTGTGSAQNIAHGLGVVPANVFVSFTGSTASQAVTEGTHTSTNIVVTVTSGATFKVWAIA